MVALEALSDSPNMTAERLMAAARLRKNKILVTICENRASSTLDEMPSSSSYTFLPLGVACLVVRRDWRQGSVRAATMPPISAIGARSESTRLQTMFGESEGDREILRLRKLVAFLAELLKLSFIMLR